MTFPDAVSVTVDDWETLSHIPSISIPAEGQRPSGRTLELDSDFFVIKQVFQQGSRIDVSDGLFAWDLHGVIAVADADIAPTNNDDIMSRHFKSCFVPEAVLHQGIKSYISIVNSLPQALDADDRLNILQVVLSKGRAFYGLDLGWLPADMPLLHFCAKHGFTECVQALLTVSGFDQSLGHRCKHRFTLLHFVAWSGHHSVLSALGAQHAKNLCDLPNEYGELPETSALIRAVELRSKQPEAAADCEIVAVRLRHLRTGAANVSLRTFTEEANTSLVSATRADKVLIPYCTHPSALIQMLQNTSLRCSDFVARHVDIAPALPALLQALRDNCNLERLVLEHCSITNMDAELLSSFLVSSEFVVASVELTGNNLGDDGVEKMADSGALQRVQSLSLGSVGMSQRGLASLAGCVELGMVEKLLVGDNDFEATDPQSLASFTRFANALRNSNKLVEIDMGKTRMQSAHLELMARAIAGAPALQTVRLNQVALRERFSDLRAGTNPLLHALLQESCAVTRLEVLLVDYPEQFTAFKRAVNRRVENIAKGCGVKGFGKGVRGKGKCKNMTRTEQVKPALLGSNGDAVIRFPMDLRARIRVNPPLHPDFKPSADLCCDNFLLNVEFEAGDFPDDVDDKCFQVQVRVRMDKNSRQYALGKAPARQQSFLCCSTTQQIHGFPALSNVLLVIHRPSTGKVMLVGRQSTESAILMRRLRDFALSTDWTLQDRFGNGGRKLLRKMSFADVMCGLALANFRDDEVRLIANADHFSNYLTWIGAPAPTPRHEADHARYMEHDIFAQVLATFKAEMDARGCRETPQQQWALPSAPLEAARISGHSDLRRVSLSWAIEQSILTHFAGAVGLDGLSNVRTQHAVEQIDTARKWRNLVFHVVVPEWMEDGERVKGQRPSCQLVEWAPIAEIANHVSDVGFAATIQNIVAKGTPHMSLNFRSCQDSAALKLRNKLANR